MPILCKGTIQPNSCRNAERQGKLLRASSNIHFTYPSSAIPQMLPVSSALEISFLWSIYVCVCTQLSLEGRFKQTYSSSLMFLIPIPAASHICIIHIGITWNPSLLQLPFPDCQQTTLPATKDRTSQATPQEAPHDPLLQLLV